MKTIILSLVFFVSIDLYSQLNISDSVSYFGSKFESGELSLFELDSALNQFFIALPDSDEKNHYYKAYQRSMAFWRSRIDFNASGEEIAGLYTRALLDYLNSPICANGDQAKWKYVFDPNPVNNLEGDSLLGQCTEAGAHTAGIIFSVFMNPLDSNIILAGSNTGGLWRTSDGGANWTCVTDHFRIPALGISDIIDISKPSQAAGSVLLALTGKTRFHDSYSAGVLKSTDGGINWTRHNIPLNEGGVMPVLLQATKPYSESNLVYAISSDNIFYSDNQGSTWYELGTIPETTSSFYGISSTSNGTIDKIYITTKGGNGKIWSTSVSEISWIDITSPLSIAASNCLDVDIDQLLDFEEGFDMLDTNSHYRPSTDTTYLIRDTTIIGDTYVLVPSLTFDGLVPSDKGGLYLVYDFGTTPKKGDVTISCNSSIPAGCRIQFYIATVGNVINDDLSITGGEGELIGEFLSPGTDAITSMSDVFTVPEGGFMDRLIVRFAFFAPYAYGSSVPILFDDLHIEINQEGQGIAPHSIGVSQGNSDEIFAIIAAQDSTIERHRLIVVNSSDNGSSWACVGASQGNSNYTTGDVLAPSNNFTAGFGIEEGYYLGGVKLIQFNPELNDILLNCSQHDDVRDIQIVKNIDGVNHLLVGDDGGVSYSADGGYTWVSLNGNGLPVTQFYYISINPHDNISMLGGTQDNGTFAGSQASWSIVGGGDGNATGFSPNTGRSDEYFYQTNSRTTVVNDGGEVYEISHSVNDLIAYLNRPAVYSPITGNFIYEGGQGKDDLTYENAVLIRHDLNPSGGYDTPTYIDFGAPSVSIGAIEVSLENESIVYVAEGNPRSALENKKLFISLDYGLTFTDLTAASTAFILDEDGVATTKKLADVFDWKIAGGIVSNPNDAGELWIGMSGVQRNGSGEVEGGLFRVLHSADSGKTWQDYSIGLPPFPINDIVYQKFTNDRLFVATDIGVFYRENGMSEWQCFQENLPPTIVSDLQINYCQQALYAGTFGRGIWRTFIDMPDTAPIVIDTDLSWGGVQQFDHDILIESGNTLTLTGTLEMAGGKRIIIEPGAHLLMNGGTLTNACEVNWAGVVVQGNASLPQTSTNQGKITLMNGALIENASIAVSLWNTGDWTTTGGIIHATNSTFKNNKKDVEFLNYQNYSGSGALLPNKSYFTNVTFTWDDDFLDEFPLGHVTLYRVNGVRFTGCAFKDERTAPASRYYLDYAKNNSGIYSIDAQYFVVPRCTDYIGGCSGSLEDDSNWQATTFENLDFGIYASNISTEYNITVDRSVFENNLYGVQTVNVNGPIITRNYFEFSDTITNNFTAYTQRGVHLVRSAGLNVQENSFINDGAANGLQGIVCSDLGESEELIYKNTFVDLSYGVITQGKNRGFSVEGDPLGLQFICDSNSTNNKDHLVLGTLWGGAPSGLYGVKAFNGSSDAPSGTVFSTDDLLPTGIHYTNESSHMINYYFNDTAAFQSPMDIMGSFDPFGTSIPNTCPSNLSNSVIQEHSSGFLTATLSDFNTYSADLDTVLTNYTNLVNGGDTDALLTIIAGLTVSNRDTVHALLLSLSPYLTEEVVRATLNHPITKYPHIWSYELVEANIEVAYKPGFMEFLETKTFPLEPGMRADIQALVDSNASTDMLAKQLEIAYLQSKKANAANILLQSLKNDTTGVNIDSVRHWIEVKGDILAQTQIIDAWLQAGNYSAAQGALTALNTDIQNYPAHLQDELTDYVSFKDKLIDLFEAGIPLDSLSETDYNFMTDLAENGEGLARYQAQELLCFFYGECAEYPVITNTTTSMAPLFQDKDTERSLSDRSFKIYPNPAQTWIAIELPVVDTPLLITVVDFSGRLIYQKQLGGINGTDRLSAVEIWDTHLIGDGVYLITINDQSTGESYGTQRVVIQH